MDGWMDMSFRLFSFYNFKMREGRKSKEGGMKNDIKERKVGHLVSNIC